MSYCVTHIRDNDFYSWDARQSRVEFSRKGRVMHYHVGLGGRRRNFLSMHVPRGWRARVGFHAWRTARIADSSFFGLLSGCSSLALLLRGTPETLLAPTRTRKVNAALLSRRDDYTIVSPQRRRSINHFSRFFAIARNNITTKVSRRQNISRKFITRYLF